METWFKYIVSGLFDPALRMVDGVGADWKLFWLDPLTEPGA